VLAKPRQLPLDPSFLASTAGAASPDDGWARCS
jgi:hypothetical protein